MRSNNPVFNRSPEFSGQTNAYGNQTYPGAGQAQPGYGDPSTWGVGAPTAPQPTAPMTIDSVVQKSGISLALVVLTAAATWTLTPEITSVDGAGMVYMAAMGGGILAFVLSLVNSFKREISPALVLAFCAVEGVALGAISKIFQGMVQTDAPIVMQAVLGTFGAFAGTLAAYKFFDIKVSDRFRKGVVAAMFGMIALGMMEMLLAAFGMELGLFENGGLGLLFAVGGLVLGVLMLLLDFDFVERGVAAGLPERESWRAAFALTVSLVWIYTNLLRILYIFNQD